MMLKLHESTTGNQGKLHLLLNMLAGDDFSSVCFFYDQISLLIGFACPEWSAAWYGKASTMCLA